MVLLLHFFHFFLYFHTHFLRLPSYSSNVDELWGSTMRGGVSCLQNDKMQYSVLNKTPICLRMYTGSKKDINNINSEVYQSNHRRPRYRWQAKHCRGTVLALC